jgi:DNA-directed RNA polymerase specialized sigma subunit
MTIIKQFAFYFFPYYILDNIVEHERLQMLHTAKERLFAIIKKGLLPLNDTEKLVLDRFFINRKRDHVGMLIQELSVEQSQVYRIKDQALHKFSINMYGIEEY